MKKEFIPYEQALALKELGFDEPCFGMYCEGVFYKLYPNMGNDIPNDIYREVDAPLYQQAFRWFREKYGFIYEVNVYSTSDGYSYSFKILCKKYTPYIEANNCWLTYEEAELECLKGLIEMVKLKQYKNCND